MKLRLQAIAAAGLLMAPGLFAQEAKEKTKTKTKDTLVFHEAVPHAGTAALVAGAPAAGRHIMPFPAAPVTGAPYAAEAVTETTQMLGDGNRIVNKTSVKMYRDSEGRTRTESTIQPLGPWVRDAKTISITTIHDPVSGEHYTLHNDSKTASKAVIRQVVTSGPGAVSVAGRKFNIEVDRHVVMSSSGTAHAPVGDLLMPGPAVMTWDSADGATRAMAGGEGEIQSSSLGKQTIEGVECEGTRDVMTIPAGAIGNERAIEVTTERWYSPELKMDLVRKHNDPRFGETVYRVSGLVRAEQPRSLFEVPADYQTEEIGPGINLKLERLREEHRKGNQPEIF